MNFIEILYLNNFLVQQTNCGFFEAQYYTCLEAFGTKLGYIYCDLEHRDLGECITHQKKVGRFTNLFQFNLKFTLLQFSRYQAMKDIRFKQWLRGDRKHKFEPTKDYIESVAASACGQNVYLMEKQRNPPEPTPEPWFHQRVIQTLKNMI